METLRSIVDSAQAIPDALDDDQHLITIDVEGGVVHDVEGLPDGWSYQVRDYDECSDCGGVEPLCEWCHEYYTQEEEDLED